MSPGSLKNDNYSQNLSRVKVRVPAKVNLVLRVGARGLDGYHPLITVFQAVGLYDDVVVTPREDDEISVSVRGVQAWLVPTDAANLAAQAASLLRKKFELPERGVNIEIDKQIPVAGGMAGGSADAAATLLACSTLWGLGMSVNELQKFGAELGSDVPFPLIGGTAIAHGRGSEIMPLMCRGTYHWALAFAESGLSTPAVFQRFDNLRTGSPQMFRRVQTAGSGAAVSVGLGAAVSTGRGAALSSGRGGAAGGRGGAVSSSSSAIPGGIPREMLTALVAGDAKAVGAGLSNDLELAALDICPPLADTLSDGRSHPGVLGGLVSGSGPTCAFLCENARAALELAADLRKLPHVRDAVAVSAPVRGAHLVSARSFAA
jgi:4-diphosphocytidyl-2-C-methyl-D-erythritol kinase